MIEKEVRKLIAESSKNEDEYRKGWFAFCEFMNGQTCGITKDDKGKNVLDYYKCDVENFLRLWKTKEK